MAKTLHSDNLTFIDLTDTKKLDVHISSNLPTMQIYDANTSTHSPDWTQGDKLQLTLTVYADSTDVTNDLTDIKWYRQIGSGVRSDSIQQGGKVLTISSNELASLGGVISYICSVTYNGKVAENQITFSRTSTGLNGTNGADGTSVNIKGTATSVAPVSGTDYYTITYSNSSITLAIEGDAYVYNGDLYVCVGLQAADGTDYFINVGRIQGPAGDSAKNIVLSGSSQVFKVSKTNVIAPSTITVTAQATNTSVTNWTYSTNGGQTFASTLPAGVARNGNIVTITGASMTSNSVVVKASDGTYSDTYTVYKALDGVDGTKGTDGQSASIAFLTNENVTFGANASGQIAATAITTNVVAYNGTTKVTPTIGTISNLPTGMTATIGTAVNNEIPITFTITNNATLGSASNNNGAITIPVNGPVYTNLIFSWSKVNSGAKGEQGTSGSDAYTVILTNESHTFAGNVSSAMAGTATTQVLAYKGSAQQSVTIMSVNGKSAAITDTDTGITGLKFKCSALSDTSPTITFTCTESFVSANGTIPIVLSVGGVSFTKMFTYAIAFKGNSGATGSTGPQGAASTSYWLISSANTVHKTSTGVITVTPSTLTFTGKAQTGTNTPVDYAGRWVIDSSADGTTYTNLYISTANEASKTITVTTAHKTIRARMYMAGGTTALLDEQIIPVVSDGTSASLVDITPSAYYFKSTTGKDGTFTPDYIYLYPRFQTVTFSKWEYSVNGGTTWVAASGANGLTIGTYNSIANTLRVAKTSTLYTDTITSISFRCVSSNASVYDTVSITKIYDVVDLHIGGRNLLLNTGFDGGVNKIYNLPSSVTSGEGGLTFNLSEPLSAGTEVALRFQIRGSANINVYWLMTGGNVAQSVKSKSNISATEFSTVEVKYTVPTGKTLNSVFICTAYGNSTAGSDWFEIKAQSLKLELGNTFTDWSPAPEDLNNVTFQIYAPNGYLLTNELQSLTLQTFAYEGSIEITSGATFQWSQLIDDTWTEINDATNTSLAVTKADVLKAKSYRCVMTYKEKSYTSTITVQDKTDTYNSIMCISSNATGNDCYWVLYTLVYSDAEEIDPLLGPVSVNAPASPVTGDYWYAVDTANASVQLKKYNGTDWANSTDAQSLFYYWDIVNDGSVKVPFGDSAKVKVISCHDFTATATLVCEVSNLEDGLLTQSSLTLTDASDPIVSTTTPTAAVNGQIWIKPNSNGTYLMFVWDEANDTWISSDMDARSKVYTSRPSSYNAGDLWITASDIDHESYLQGTLLQAQTYNNTYNASDWSPTLRYDYDLDDVKETLNNLSQYVTITPSGLRVAARDQNGNLSKFTSLFTSEALTFYEASQPLLVLANNQLTAPKIVVEDELEVQGEIRLGDLKLVQETNGSFSFVVSK